MLTIGCSPVSLPMLGGGRFNPSVFGKLIAGYEADYGITLNGGTVSAWAPRWVAPGQAQAALALTQATAANQPDYVADRGDGKPCLRGFESLSPTTARHMLSTAVGALIGTEDLVTVLAQYSTGTNEYGGAWCLLTGADSPVITNWPAAAGAGVLMWSTGTGGTITQTLSPTGYSSSAMRSAYIHYRAGNRDVKFGDATNTAARTGTHAAAIAKLRLGSNNLSYSAAWKLSSLWVFAGGCDVAAAAAEMQARWPNYG